MNTGEIESTPYEILRLKYQCNELHFFFLKWECFRNSVTLEGVSEKSEHSCMSVYLFKT